MTTITDKLADDLFALGSVGPDRQCNRIQFMLGEYRDGETAGGGMSRVALKRWMAERIAAYASQQAESSEARVEPYTARQHFALRDAHCVAAGDAYFEVRPHLRSDGPRRETFDDGFVRGFDKATELANTRSVLKAADAVSAGVPNGFVLVPEKATPLIREALRIGMRREVPNDELCDIRWRAAIAAAAPGSEQKEGANG